MDSPSTLRTRRDVFAGLCFLLIAAGFAVEGLNYPAGTLRSMGPGYVPMALSLILGSLGILIAIAGVVRPEPFEASPVPWRGIVFIVVALIVFGSFATRLGLVPVVFVCGVLTALSSERNGPVAAVVIGALLSVLCWLVFKQGLGLPIPTFGPLVAPLLDLLLDLLPGGAPAAPPAPVPSG